MSYRGDRNPEHYMDLTASTAIRRASRKRHRKRDHLRRRKSWGERLTYKIGQLESFKQAVREIAK